MISQLHKSLLLTPLPSTFSTQILEQHFGEQALALCPNEVPDVITSLEHFHDVLQACGFFEAVWVKFSTRQIQKFNPKTDPKRATRIFEAAITEPVYRREVGAFLWKQFRHSETCSRSRFCAGYLAHVLTDWNFLARMLFDAYDLDGSNSMEPSEIQKLLQEYMLDYVRLSLAYSLFGFEVFLQDNNPSSLPVEHAATCDTLRKNTLPQFQQLVEGLETSLRDHAIQCAQTFLKKVDKNSDGRVSFKEFRSCFVHPDQWHAAVAEVAKDVLPVILKGTGIVCAESLNC